MMRPTRCQNLALVIFGLVKEMKTAPHRDSYAGYAVELPSWIRNNGLAQTLAFLEHKARSEDGTRASGARSLHADFCDVLHDMEVRTRPGREPQRGDNAAGESVATLDAFDYLVATKRALEASEYFKRFAESVLDADRGQRGAQP